MKVCPSSRPSARFNSAFQESSQADEHPLLCVGTDGRVPKQVAGRFTESEDDVVELAEQSHDEGGERS